METEQTHEPAEIPDKQPVENDLTPQDSLETPEKGDGNPDTTVDIEAQVPHSDGEDEAESDVQEVAGDEAESQAPESPGVTLPESPQSDALPSENKVELDGQNVAVNEDNIKALESSTPSDSDETSPKSKPPKEPQNQIEENHKSAKNVLSEKELSRRIGLLVSDFAACGRCSYFLTGYRVVHGMVGMETAVSTHKGKWLKLAWNHEMRELMSKSYGVLLNVEFYHYDSCCSECSRRFILKTIETKENQFKELLIEISN
ncbi:MAG: hypothetical protein GY943_08990 [Chloroflexi bacterium]|nr:hypothetical protein [Chloroflexota bacterium]